MQIGDAKNFSGLAAVDIKAAVACFDAPGRCACVATENSRR